MVPRGWATAAMLLLLTACCDERNATVGDMQGRLRFGFEFAAKVKFDFSVRFNFASDIRVWSGVLAASTANLHYDIAGKVASRQTVKVDVDDDGVDETVDLVAFGETDGSTPERVFAVWKGDEYTFDEGRCYLLWWEGSQIEMLNGACQVDEPALHCEATAPKADALACDVCSETGACAPCHGGTVPDCEKEGERTLRSESGTGGKGGSGGTRDSGADGALHAAGGTADASTTDAPATDAPATEDAEIVRVEAGAEATVSGSASGSVEFNSCVEQTKSLQSSANRCSRGALADTSVLCQDRLSDVNLCYLAVQATGLINTECSALANQVCQGVFP